MRKAEKSVSWWRRALRFALAGIRSGFGLFPSAQKAEPVTETESSARLEVTLEEETALTDSSPTPDVLPISPAAAAEPVAEAAPAERAAEATAEPETVASPEPVSESAPEATEPSQATKPLPEVEPMPAVSLPEPSAPSELEPEAEAVPEEQTGPNSVAEDAAEAESAAAEEKAAAKLAARQKKLNESAEQSPFSIIVGQVYDGPLDLLLDLIRKQDIDIYDIPIATITAQFLAYVNQLKAGDVDVAGEFIYTASLLIHIKSKMLLPRSPSGPDEAAEDPRRELVERLLEHERFKNAAQMLQQKQMLEAASWTNPGVREFKDDAAAEPEIAADTVDLVRIFRDILERARKRPSFDLEEDSVTVGQMVQFLARRLTMEDKPIALRRLLSHTRSERALIAMFLALLELVRVQAILLRQDRAFSEIFIKKHVGFESVMNQGLASGGDDWR
jgi:segregation and condensation protein A